MSYFRDRRDYLLHLAVRVALDEQKGDWEKASPADKAEAMAILRNAGMKVPEVAIAPPATPYMGRVYPEVWWKRLLKKFWPA